MRYMPIMSIYFANGFLAFSQIAETFWIKNSLSLTVAEVISITIWANLPWSMKILFGQLLDNVRIAKSARHIYVWIAAAIILIGNIITIGVAHQFPFITSLGSTYHLLIAAGLTIQLGIVIQDLIADTLCYEVVPKLDEHGAMRSSDDINKEISNIQILARIFDITAAILATAISGVIASHYSYAAISWFTPIVALISVIGVMMVKTEAPIPKEKVQMPILLGGLVYIAFLMGITGSGFAYAQETVFLVGMSIVLTGLYIICKDLDPQRKKEIFCILVVIYAFRAVPEYSPGVEWWQIDVLQFTPEFFSMLKQIGMVLSFVGIWVLAKHIVNRNVGFVLFWLNAIQALLHLPIIAMAFGLHEWTLDHWGFGARTIALIDTTAEGPFQKLGFLVLCTVATYYAPKRHVVSWFALVMSLMSLATLSGGRILKKMLSNTFIIERGAYENVGDLMITTTLIQFLLPTVVILIFLNPFKRKITSEPIALPSS